MSVEIIQADCLEAMRAMPAGSVDLVFTSPPYEAARTYGIAFDLKGQAFVDWCVERYLECMRVSKGLVAWVIEGQTRKFQYSASPILLMADLHRRGVKLRKPPIFHRVGIPGSGGPDWLRHDYEFIVCAASGKLPWSDNTAMGKPPKWQPGGAMSNRQTNGSRVGYASPEERQRLGPYKARRAGAKRIQREATEAKVADFIANGGTAGSKLHTKSNGSEMRVQCYTPPAIANPGNVITTIVGGGTMGHEMCHENEAPFPESLAEFFIRSFCPPGGTVLDPFSGSGTTIAVAKRCQRCGIGIDIRESQVALAKRRVATVQVELIA